MSLADEKFECPDKPNCVSSLTKSKKHFMEPWTLMGSKEESLKKIKEIALSEPRVELVSESGDLLHFVFTSRLLRFKDDVFFTVQGDKLHYKSASRLGYRDFDVNKERIEKLKEAYYAK